MRHFYKDALTQILGLNKEVWFVGLQSWKVAYSTRRNYFNSKVLVLLNVGEASMTQLSSNPHQSAITSSHCFKQVEEEYRQEVIELWCGFELSSVVEALPTFNDTNTFELK